jgi:ABC-type dipeptide/oligopeptide/nickel transport system permease subunit
MLLAIPLGIAAASARHKALSGLVMVLSVLGASTPSFLLAMLLWVVNILVHQTFKIRVLPATGFGWDGHMVMPMLVLAMRPLAQIAQVTYITMSEALRQDYIRTGHAKGLPWRVIRDKHALPNVLIPVLNTLGSSLRFSLASLPIIEVFFHWPGVGSMLLDAINAGTAPLVLDLILSLGAFFLVVNLLIDFSFPLIDPRLQAEELVTSRIDAQPARETLQETWEVFTNWLAGLRRLIPHAAGKQQQEQTLQTASEVADSMRRKRHQWIRRSLLRNPTLIATSLILLLLLALAVFGPTLPGVSPYEIHGVMSIEGKYAAPPFKPTSVFPWGTDHIGRDMRSLVLAGAQKTLSLAFFGMLARVLLGTVLGILAGWGRGGRFDRVVSAALSIWAAFPATLFAMIVIQALGIQQGMWVFIVAICVVGWGEVAQFVRGQVVTLKPSLFVESARSVGARADQILLRHILPNLANSIIVLAALEMGGVLMLLAELGFLNVFMGGGFKTMVGETGSMQAIIAYYSDVPEWGALIANVRAQWRAYPWMALYPGAAVLISILTFNLFGEGLRRFLEDSAVSLSRFFNRYTFGAAAGVVAALALILQSSVPLNVYRAEGLKFDEQRVLEDVRMLSSRELQGRETGTDGATLAALYIAHRMADIGIFPAGEHYTYLQHQLQPRLHMTGLPALALLDETGATIKQLAYRQDFVEITRDAHSHGEAQARIMGVAYGPTPEGATRLISLGYTEAAEHIIIVRQEDLPKVQWTHIQGILVIAEDAGDMRRRYVYPAEPVRGGDTLPALLISAEAADSLLRSAGSSLAALDAMRLPLAPGEAKFTGEGRPVSMSLPAAEADEGTTESYINVIGVIPGQGTFMGTEEQIIMVSAYYDGLGTDPAGTVYPGANDNASGVAMMLELARLLKESTYKPDKTVLFVAWASGERQEGLSTVNILNARAGASDMTVETVFELSGVGHGTGKAISIGSESSYRMVQLFQQAADRYRIPTTTLGRGPHYNLPPRAVLGGRDAMTLSLSWDGSDDLAHTPEDTASTLDPAKLRDIGRPAYLTLLILCRETEY